MKKVIKNNGKGTYVLTCDLGSKVKLLKHIGLKTPESNDSFFKGFQSELARLIGVALPNAEVITMSMEDLADDILTEALRKQSLLQDAVVVSSCAEIAIPRKGHIIEINRIVDERGKIIGLGPRPGFPSLDEQLESIRVFTVDRPIIIVEDGSFTGGTMCHVIRKFKDKGIKIAAVVIGFAFPKALAAIQREYSGEIIVIEKLNELLDWMPDHDFFPFTPNCGRVFDLSISGQNYPFYTHNNASYSVPYIIPFGNMREWSSIPDTSTGPISLFCLQQALALFERIEKLSGKEIKIGDILGTRPKISIPISIGQNVFPRLDTRITSFLSETCHELT